MTLLGILIGCPSESWRNIPGRIRPQLPVDTLVRFINDVLLSAPSIIIGLFIYEIVVVKMGHFSAIGERSRSRFSRSVTCGPPRICSIWCRGHEGFVAALGAYPWRTVVSVLIRPPAWYRYGSLVGNRTDQRETAPLLFTALNNQFWSTQLNAPWQSSGGHLPVCAESLQGMAEFAWAVRSSSREHIDLEHLRSRRTGNAAGERGPDDDAFDQTAKHLKTRGRFRSPCGVPNLGPPKIEIRSLNFYYGELQALYNINMTLADRSITAFIVLPVR